MIVVTGTDGQEYEIRMGVLVQDVVDMGQVNPLDDLPIFNLQATLVSATARKSHG